MSVAQAAHPAPAHDTSTGLSHAKVAVWTFLASECLLFGALISTFLLYRSRSLSGPTPSRHTYDIAYTSGSRLERVVFAVRGEQARRAFETALAET